MLGSDHNPILITYEDEMVRVNNKPKFKWKLDSADWEKYMQDVEDTIPKKNQVSTSWKRNFGRQ